MAEDNNTKEKVNPVRGDDSFFERYVRDEHARPENYKPFTWSSGKKHNREEDLRKLEKCVGESEKQLEEREAEEDREEKLRKLREYIVEAEEQLKKAASSQNSKLSKDAQILIDFVEQIKENVEIIANGADAETVRYVVDSVEQSAYDIMNEHLTEQDEEQDGYDDTDRAVINARNNDRDKEHAARKEAIDSTHREVLKKIEEEDKEKEKNTRKESQVQVNKNVMDMLVKQERERREAEDAAKRYVAKKMADTKETEDKLNKMNTDIR